MVRSLILYLCLSAVASGSPVEKPTPTFVKDRGNWGYVETAGLSYYDGRAYISGIIKPHYWGSGKIYIKVDLKDSLGRVVASKTGYTYATGRPQSIVDFGLTYVVSFEPTNLCNVTTVQVSHAL